MKNFTDTQNFLNFRNMDLLSKKVGLVPTMGNLHQGHLNLVSQALAENEYAIVTIFVNPKQFGPNEDFEKYPRTLEQDMEKLKKLSGSERIILFAPQNPKEIYPDNFSTTIEVEGLDKALCGKNRPGHFKGVCTVVYRLFLLTTPYKAYFGQKDYQQFKIIQKMTEDLLLPIKLEMVPIARDSSGLALSSRNQYLSNEQKVEALKLKNSIEKISNQASLSLDLAIIMAKEIQSQDSRFQYLDILDAETLSPPSAHSNKVVVAGAFLLGDTRLIDNDLVSLGKNL